MTINEYLIKFKDTSFYPKILSVQQPWALLIVLGYKDIENRNWRTNYRGEFLVHAGKTFDKDSLLYIQEEWGILEGMTKSDFETGGIVGKSSIIDCVSSSNSKFFFGKYGFELDTSKSERLDFLPYKGQLNFFSYRQ
ncbi:ASCH domain-containing protein [Leptospira sp. GIMC2001]|uniref:ASCH domain-containing protein n=1 Tax=Leptospira sp. GIMC2001 TaxID=1513297 RepID=UPI00234A5FAA|nr:ASCH domain-containing protein [Leptospira sp. GIMC2001]WCL51440.1 ASCH domain-containing protein [Leptospira sp. GIMC2001]